jgi:hypothetical protein
MAKSKKSSRACLLVCLSVIYGLKINVIKSLIHVLPRSSSPFIIIFLFLWNIVDYYYPKIKQCFSETGINNFALMIISHSPKRFSSLFHLRFSCIVFRPKTIQLPSKFYKFFDLRSPILLLPSLINSCVSLKISSQ